MRASRSPAFCTRMNAREREPVKPICRARAWFHVRPVHGDSQRTRRPRRLARGIGILVVAGLTGLLVYGLTTEPASVSLDEALRRGESLPAPGFDLAALDGRVSGPLAGRWRRATADGQVRLDELRGTPVALNFWASWCDPCRAEIAILQRHWEDAQTRGVLVLGMNQQDAQTDARAFLAKHDVTFPSVRDPGKDTARAWGVTGTPETFFVSAAGDVVAHVIGVISDAQMRAGMAAARRGSPAGVSEGGDRRPTR